MALLDQYALTQGQEFRNRVTMALVIAAKDVQGEAPGEMSATRYSKRQALARSVILGPTQYVDRFVWLAATNVGLLGTPSDNDIQFTVNSLWDDAAGVDAND
jgi:hypothetical protein